MSQILSSWKEIAQYLGKGVRTVQRWELHSGLPVRRARGSSRTIVAYTDEIDHWLDRGRSESDELARLRARLREVAAHNQQLQRQLRRLRDDPANPPTFARWLES